MKDEDIKHLAQLARIALTDEEVRAYRQEIGDILGYIEQVNGIVGDIDGPIESATVRNVFREDENAIASEAYTEALLNEAPKTRNQFIEVQKILDTNNES